MPRSGAVTLSDLIAPTLTLVCGQCGRKGVYSVARLQTKHVDVRLSALGMEAGWPKPLAGSVRAQRFLRQHRRASA
jgi:hypothetical protein